MSAAGRATTIGAGSRSSTSGLSKAKVGDKCKGNLDCIGMVCRNGACANSPGKAEETTTSLTGLWVFLGIFLGIFLLGGGTWFYKKKQ